MGSEIWWRPTQFGAFLKGKTMIIKIGKYQIIIDKEEYWRIRKYSYRPHSRRDRIYFRRSNINTYYLHREIMNTPKGMEVDHINGNTFDCRKINMRNCTHTENTRNHNMQKNNTSGYKSVYWRKDRKKWVAKIRVNKKQIYIGSYINAKDAYIAYCKVAKNYFGEFANYG
jgi:hypothetical protein